MKATLLGIIITVLMLTGAAYAQNPYQSMGKEVKVLTLSGGKFKEFHPNDSLRRIGSVIVNVRTKEVYQFIEQDTLYNEANLDPTVISRWLSLDPLMAKYPSISPYAFVGNNPILMVDADGRDGIAYWETKGNKRTLVIKADYHHIQGQFDENVLSAVQSEYASYKNIMYNGEKVSVRFEIGFISHDEGTDLSIYDGSNGQNRLIKEALFSETPELSDYMEVSVDVDAINNSVVSTPKGDKPLSEGDKFKKQVSATAHGIGHNIGLIHADEGIMLDLNTVVYEMPGLLDPSVKVYNPQFFPNHVTKDNVQNLTNRIDGMTEQGRDYWKGKTEVDKYTGKTRDISNTGVVRFKEKE